MSVGFLISLRATMGVQQERLFIKIKKTRDIKEEKQRAQVWLLSGHKELHSHKAATQAFTQQQPRISPP